MHTYIFKNKGDFPIQLEIGAGKVITVYPNTFFQIEGGEWEELSGSLYRLYGQGNLDYWVFPLLLPHRVDWQKEGF